MSASKFLHFSILENTNCELKKNSMQRSFLIYSWWGMCNSAFLPSNLPSLAKSIFKSADNILTQLPPA